MEGKMFTLFVLMLLLLQDAVAAPSGKIKHVIVLMEENRSFDHMFGYFPGVNGLKGTEYNLVNSSNPSSTKVEVNSKQPQVALCDPDHGTTGTAIKIFGAAAASKGEYKNASMIGFVERENQRGNALTHYCNVMATMNPETVPVITSLAENFALMERLFCDHPGPTWPNRLYMLTGTAAGCTSTGTYYHNVNGKPYPQPTFYDQVEKAGLTWRHYYNDTPWETFIDMIAKNPQNIHNMDHFYEDAKKGTLPHFAFINPRAGGNSTTKEGSNDQHPDHDVSLGEKYYKDVYEALRASPQWNETVFIVTYDEHGGFYDHVPTPLGVPPPGDGEESYPDKGFMFDRLGVRIPTLIISPWIPKGTLVNMAPEAQKPAKNSEYTLTSIMATARKLLGMTTGPLTKRDAWAATFEHLFSLEAPRTDCPLHLPSAAKQTLSYRDESQQPLNDLQKDILHFHSTLVGVKYPSHITKQGDLSEWLKEHYDMHVERTLSRK